MERPAQGGEAIARLSDGRICFVSGALPGELALVELSKTSKDFAKGVAREILEAHPQRVKPRCPLFGRCGGCSMQHAAFDLQLEMLEAAVRDTFRRFTKTELPAGFKITYGEPWHYRNRARVVRGKNGFGFRETASHRVIEFRTCAVLVPALGEFLRSETAKGLRAGELEVFENGRGEVAYFHEGMNPRAFAAHSETLVKICGTEISTDAAVFFQSNLGLLPRLVESVKAAAGSGPFLIDLFSGVGFFASILQGSFERVVAVERDRHCLRHAARNLKGSAEFVAEPAEEWLLGNVVSPGATLIVDPPRTGLPKPAAEAICNSALSKLVYVSCDPVTLSRDAKLLLGAGFKLLSAEAFAFYPQTPHLEMLAVLER